MAEISRRNLICGLAACAAVPIVAACGGSDAVSGSPAPAGTTPAAGAATPATGATSAAAPAGAIATSEIPVGSAKIFADRALVVTQPVAGEFKAFSANCTHVGTMLNKVDGTALVCPNHGSRFSIVDGSVEQGPASAPLPEKTVEKVGDSLVVSG